MSTYNFDLLTKLTETFGTDIDIVDFEPDDFIRRTKYPHVVSIKTDVYTYTNPDSIENPIIRTILTKKLRASRGVLDRYLHWTPYGAALNNKETTTICDPVFISSSNKLEDIIKPEKKAMSGGVYKPKLTVLEPKPSKNTGFYKPSLNNITSAQKNTNSSLIVKNFPTDSLKDVLEDRLHSIFSRYGAIKRINILTDKRTGCIKDIAFIDFYNAGDSTNVIETAERFILDNLILTVEKNTKSN
uniref:RRM domain-containing protein n=1 Tax=viral metagenome TaxID=1070528 RepID=A0A6C0EKR5_9ZZZZ